MAVTREIMESQITARMQQKGMTRPQAIEDLREGAEKGPGEPNEKSGRPTTPSPAQRQRVFD
jgi:hypothetical protein